MGPPNLLIKNIPIPPLAQDFMLEVFKNAEIVLKGIKIPLSLLGSTQILSFMRHLEKKNWGILS